MDKAYASTVGKKWMDNRNRNLNKTSNPKDCLDMVKGMWDSHIYATKQAEVVGDIHSKFAKSTSALYLISSSLTSLACLLLKMSSSGEEVGKHTCFSTFSLTSRRTGL